MKYRILPSCVWTYPDIHDYKEASDKASLLALRGGYAAFQIHITDASGDNITISPEGLSCELYLQVPIFVESCPGIETPIPHFPEREAPFYVNDCLKPIEGIAKTGVESTGLYIAVIIPEDAPETIKGSIKISDERETISVPVSITVSKCSLPPERLEIVMGISFPEIFKYHNVQSREEFDSILTQYLSLLRRQHQTRLYVEPPREKFENGKWTFDFTRFNNYIKKALSMGFRTFNIGGIGFRRAWDAPDIYHYNIDLLSREGYLYLEQYLPALRQNLEENGWLDGNMIAVGVADEPNDINALSFRALTGVVRKFLPELKIYEATSSAPIFGALDIWIPRTDEYEENREMFDHYKNAGDEIWHYVCLFPRENGYINRFMDIPLLSTRYLYWGNYKYGLTGYLHWTVNCYQADCDPFKLSCPRHVNAGSESILPPGDDKLIYPGDDKRGWMSMRLENHRESAEEYAMLAILAEKDKPLADSICEKVFHSFNSVEFDAKKFEDARRELIQAYEKINNTGI